MNNDIQVFGVSNVPKGEIWINEHEKFEDLVFIEDPTLIKENNDLAEENQVLRETLKQFRKNYGFQ